ncbi:uncharacterized protein C14orf119 [Topomyia yanbarensis]|uniref:uncharacterized protein C14orf119 n=1 Tax=Topomyia yanbarensis TaxID=2498891 RepID=UPI00273B0C09|nr:uncharacterized protein C14orf119 [Topomyia yanbarensis]
MATGGGGGGAGGGGILGSGHNLTVDREFRYVIQWFTEWSDFQREDFVPVMATYLAESKPPGGPVYVNGIISGMANVSGQDKPMSLFQCRVKLFNQWSSKWPETYRDKLLERLTEIDSDFERLIQQELAGISPRIDPAYPGDPAATTDLPSSPPPELETSPEPTTPTATTLLVIGED